MDENIIKRKFLETISKLKRYDKAYYDKSSPVISDSEYDLLKKSIIDLQKKYKFLKDIDSPSKEVGFKPSRNFKKKITRFQCYL